MIKKAQIIVVLDTQRLLLSCFIATAVDEFNRNASKPKFLLEDFCNIQATLAKPRQRALCPALGLARCPWCGKEGDRPVCSGRWWDGFGPLRREQCSGLVGWLRNTSSKKRGAVIFTCLSWWLCDLYKVVCSWVVPLPMAESFQRRSTSGLDVSVQCHNRKGDALMTQSCDSVQTWPHNFQLSQIVLWQNHNP